MPFPPVLIYHRNMLRDGLDENAQYTPMATLQCPFTKGPGLSLM